MESIYSYFGKLLIHLQVWKLAVENKDLKFRDATLAHPAGIFFAEYYSFEALFSRVLPGGPLIESEGYR